MANVRARPEQPVLPISFSTTIHPCLPSLVLCGAGRAFSAPVEQTEAMHA